MKSLRFLVLAALMAFPMAVTLQAQQEVSPDFFETQSSGNGGHRVNVSAHKHAKASHHHRSNVKVASKHHGNGMHHHHAHASA